MIFKIRIILRTFFDILRKIPMSVLSGIEKIVELILFKFE